LIFEGGNCRGIRLVDKMSPNIEYENLYFEVSIYIWNLMEYYYWESANKLKDNEIAYSILCTDCWKESRYEVTDISCASVNFKEPLRERIHWLLKVWKRRVQSRAVACSRVQSRAAACSRVRPRAAANFEFARCSSLLFVRIRISLIFIYRACYRPETKIHSKKHCFLYIPF